MSDVGLSDPGWKEKVRERRDWCGENCRAQVFHDMLTEEARWSFVSEEDAMAFKLRWM